MSKSANEKPLTLEEKAQLHSVAGDLRGDDGDFAGRAGKLQKSRAP